MLGLIFLSSPIMAGDQASVILEGIRERYGPMSGLSSTYRREILSRSMAMLGDRNGGDLATGLIYFKPPYFLKIKQETPKPEIITTDGNILWWYIPHKKLVYRYPSNKLGRELRLLGDVFQGLREVEENFQVTLLEAEKKGAFRLMLKPVPPWPETDHINLTVTRDNYSILAVEIHNLLGNITKFDFENIHVQDDIKKDFFRFTVPEGVRVIKEE